MNTQQILEERGNQYGSFQDNSKTVVAMLDAINEHPNAHLLEPFQYEAIHMILHKIGRVIGNPDNSPEDTYKDIAGYAMLLSGEIE